MERTEIITVAKKAADAWRNTDTYHQAAQIIDMLVEELEQNPTPHPAERVGERGNTANGAGMVSRRDFGFEDREI